MTSVNSFSLEGQPWGCWSECCAMFYTSTCNNAAGDINRWHCFILIWLCVLCIILNISLEVTEVFKDNSKILYAILQRFYIWEREILVQFWQSEEHSFYGNKTFRNASPRNPLPIRRVAAFVSPEQSLISWWQCKAFSVGVAAVYPSSEWGSKVKQRLWLLRSYEYPFIDNWGNDGGSCEI